MIEVIAEIGVNHNGDYHTACKLIDAAKEAGCDTAKFQLWNSERVYPRERWDEMKKLELTRHEMESLKKYCDNQSIEFLCTPDEIEDAQFLKDIGVKRIKTSSQDITNIPYLTQIAELGLPMIVSTGACDRMEMDKAIATLVHVMQDSSLTVLHCVSCYPAPVSQLNLSVIKYLRKTWAWPVIGFSDHTIGNIPALVALGLGARVFEKHLTLDVFQAGPDHAASVSTAEISLYVSCLRQAEEAIGGGAKRVMPCEMENRKRYEEFIKPRKERS